jgi:hypothetical protein
MGARSRAGGPDLRQPPAPPAPTGAGAAGRWPPVSAAWRRLGGGCRTARDLLAIGWFVCGVLLAGRRELVARHLRRNGRER